MKKLLAVIMAGILALSLAACGGSAEPSSTPAPESQAAPAEGSDSAEPAAAGAAGKKISILTANLSSVTTNQMCEMMKAGMEKESAGQPHRGQRLRQGGRDRHRELRPRTDRPAAPDRL